MNYIIPLDRLRYSFVESFEASRYLTIDSITGEIRTSQKIDRELSGASLKFTLQATDKSKFFTEHVRAYSNLISFLKMELTTDEGLLPI